MKSLLIFESKTLVDQLVRGENPKLVSKVLDQFVEAVRQYVGYYNLPPWDQFFEVYMDDAYICLISEDMEGKSIINAITEEGEAIDRRLRFRELMDVCVVAWKDEMVSTLIAMRDKAEIISTAKVVGYDKHKLAILVYSIEAPQ